ncbi:MAG: BatA domain-containing protein [Chloroflexota bacterium]
MNFLNPLVLFGLAAAAIPVLLHLLNLRKLKRVEFSTLKFLKEMQKTKIRRLKLKQWILLALRALAVIFAVLAFSRPTIPGSLPLFSAAGKTTAIILIDNSYSMELSDEFGSRFTQSKKAAADILNSLSEGDEAIALPLAGAQFRDKMTPSRNFARLSEDVRNIRLSAAPADLEGALKLASAALEDSRNINKEIFIISDGQANVFRRETAIAEKIKAKNANIYFVPIGLESRADLKNLSVDSVNVVSRIFQSEKPVEIEAIVRNHSDEDARGAVIALNFNGRRVAQRSADIPARSTRSIAISASEKSPGTVRASVELEGDALDADNYRHFGFIIPQAPKAAVFAGGESATYLRLVINSLTRTARIDAQFFSDRELGGVDLARYDMIIAAGAFASPGDADRLRRFLQSGGSALIFGNDSPEFISNMAAVGFPGLTVKNFSREQPAGFVTVNKAHPLFEGVFAGGGAVESPKIYSALPAQSGESIIQMPGGAFLAEQKTEGGRILYCAVEPSTVKSNLPLTGIFPAIVYRGIIYLSATEDFAAESVPGKPINIPIPKKFAVSDNYKIIDPEGKETYARAAELPTGQFLKLDPPARPGVYAVQNINGQVVSTVAVNLDKTESDIGSPSKGEIKEKLAGYYESKTHIDVLPGYGKLNAGIARARTGSELWQLFLALAILCAVAEMIVEKNTRAEIEGA